MPIYIFKHPKTGKLKEIVMSVHDNHEYIDNKGLKWERVFTVPQTNVDTKIDPFNSRDFSDKTGKKKGSMSDIWDASKELSEKRERIIGQDPVKEQYYKDYSKKRRGRKHPEQIRAETNDFNFEI